MHCLPKASLIDHAWTLQAISQCGRRCRCCRSSKAVPSTSSVASNGRHLSVTVPDAKADRLGLKAQLPSIIAFVIPHLTAGKHVLVTDSSGVLMIPAFLRCLRHALLLSAHCALLAFAGGACAARHTNAMPHMLRLHRLIRLHLRRLQKIALWSRPSVNVRQGRIAVSAWWQQFCRRASCALGLALALAAHLVLQKMPLHISLGRALWSCSPLQLWPLCIRSCAGDTVLLSKMAAGMAQQSQLRDLHSRHVRLMSLLRMTIKQMLECCVRLRSRVVIEVHSAQIVMTPSMLLGCGWLTSVSIMPTRALREACSNRCLSFSLNGAGLASDLVQEKGW